MKTRKAIEAISTSQVSAGEAEEHYGPGQHPNSRKNLTPFEPGVSGNPSGRPKRDMSQVIARQLFENNPELIYEAYGNLLKKGSAFGFQVLAERAFGKLKETRDTGADFNDIPDGSLEERVTQLERECYPALYPGLTREAGEAARAGSTKAGTSKANGKAQDPHVLPGNGAIKA